MSVPIGINFRNFSSNVIWLSPDIWATSNISLSRDGKLHLDSILSSDYIPGTNIITVEDPDIFTTVMNYPGQNIQQNFCINTSSGIVGGVAIISVGSPYIQVKWSKPSYDVLYSSGSYIWFNNNWSNTNLDPNQCRLPGEYVDNSGRHTSYPAGLNTGQSLNVQLANNNIPSGVYTFIGDGNGIINYRTHNKYTNQPYNGSAIIVSGVNTSDPITLPADSFFDWTVFKISASDTTNPLCNVQLVMDGFADIYQANKNNPNFFAFHPELLKKLEPFSLIRYMDTLRTNNCFTQEWSEKPVYKGTSLGLSAPESYFEWIPQLSAATNTDIWWCVPHGASDDYINKLANFLLNNVVLANPTLNTKIIVEYSNEVWNWGFTQCAYANYMGIQSTNLCKIDYGVCDRNIVTIRKSKHGFQDKELVLIENCQNDSFNGIFEINYIDQDSFSYSVAPKSFYEELLPRHHHVITAINVNNPNVDTVESIQWDGYSSITIKTQNPHNFGRQDAIQIFNATDPGFNQLFWILQVIDQYTFVCRLSNEGFKRSTPEPVPTLVVNGIGKNNQSIKLAIIAHGDGPSGPGIVSSWNGQQYYATRSAQIDQIIYNIFAGYEDRLEFVLCWQMPNPHYISIKYNSFEYLLSDYKAALGGSFLPISNISIAAAPYFSSPDQTVKNTYDKATTITSITNSGNSAIVSAPNHNFSNNDNIGIFNVNPYNYCGVYNINVIDSGTFSYNINTTGISNGKFYDPYLNIMFAVKNPPYFREITQTSVSGNVLYCYSSNHGLLDQSGAFICNAPQNFFNSPLNGLFDINYIDSNNFNIIFDNTQQYLLQPNKRLWVYSEDAVQSRLQTYNPASSTLPAMANLQLAASANPPVSIRCYEAGFGDTNSNGLSSNLPPYIDLMAQCALSDQMGNIYSDFYDKLYNTYDVKCVNHYNFIDPWSKWGMWGLLRFISDPITTRYRSVAQFSEKYPIPSGWWNTYSGLVPYFCFDSGCLPYTATMSLLDVDTNTNFVGNTLIQLPNVYFQPSGTIQSNNYNVYCDASNEIGTKMPTQCVNVKITVQ